MIPKEYYKKFIYEKSGLLKVNFDPALTCLLREVRFFLIFDIEVQQPAHDIFNKSATYRQWFAQLDHHMTMYNWVLTELLPVEDPENSKLLYATMTDIRDVKLATNVVKKAFEWVIRGVVFLTSLLC